MLALFTTTLTHQLGHAGFSLWEYMLNSFDSLKSQTKRLVKLFVLIII